MKIIELNNLQKPCVLVELPKEARLWPRFDGGYFFTNAANKTPASIGGIVGPVKLLGHFPSLKERDFEGLVYSEQVFMPDNGLNDWPTVYYSDVNGSRSWTAHQAFVSAVKAQEKVVDLNKCYLFIKNIAE